MPRSDDIIRRQFKPVDPGDYVAALSTAQLAEIKTVCPDGVCD